MSLNLEQANSGTFTLSKAGLGIGSTTSQLSTAAVAAYCIDGVYKTPVPITASFALAVPPLTRADLVTGAVINLYVYSTVGVGQKSAFGVWADAAGSLTVTQGPVVNVNSNNDLVSPPPNPGSRALIGYVTVFNASLSANGGFRPQTDAFSTAGLTTVYADTFSFLGKLGL